MLCIIGLGNPGNQYDATRHNLGFDVVDVLARTLRIQLKAGKGEYFEGLGTFEGNDVHLVKPLTYMNNSGSAVMELSERYNLAPDQLFVVCDDFQLPLGTLRLRPRGSDGGHNGLYSIIYHLQSDSFPRLRCGIASESIPKDKSLMAQYVLEPFTAAERPEVHRMVTRAAEACLHVVRDGIDRAMNLYNTKPTPIKKD